jgi:thiamine pyrophosphate-dependent acetolactate synthase large subunit-like protein
MTSHSTRTPFVAVVVTTDARYFAGTALAIADAARAAGSPSLTLLADLVRPADVEEPHPVYVEALALARRYLQAPERERRLAVTLVQAPTLEQAAERCGNAPADAGPVGIVFIDTASTRLEADARLPDRLDAFYARLSTMDRPALRSPFAVVVHRASAPWARDLHVLPDRWTHRLLQREIPWLLRAEQLSALMDFVEWTLDRPRNHRAALRESASALGDELLRFLSARAGTEWLFLSYTSTKIAPFIEHVERSARARSVLTLRAANEHGLAAGALAEHLLRGRPSLVAVGNAMMDELRGTLANLRAAEAQGFIVCPEAPAESRFMFQGTITPDEDIRAVLHARGVPCVYMEAARAMPVGLEEAFRLYDEGRGPVVLLVTQEVLDEKGPLERAPRYPSAVERPRIRACGDDALERAIALVNRERVKVLWQASRLDEEEERLCQDIVQRAAIALCDSLGHPGPTHRDGKPLENHLGTLGLYGFNQPAYAFLHEGKNKLSPRDGQCVFFLKSKVGQRATTLSPSRREGIRMVQVTHRADHVAPDVELALVMPAKDFLRAMHARLAVESEVRCHRSRAIQAARAACPPGSDLASRMPSLPMTPSFFFQKLAGLVEAMIADDGYAYTGVYDVGRCSVSAMRAVPRTGRGFSGWYGRALMGDAPAALPVLAAATPGNVVAFIGDGARSNTADPVPALLDGALTHPERFDKNITVFTFSNGTFSGIRAYREHLSSRWGGRQTRALDVLPPDGEERVGPLRVVRRRIVAFDAGELRASLLERARLNLFTVLVGHNTDDDGFSLVTTSWQRGA